MEIDLELKNLFQKIQEVPSVPFLTKLQTSYLKQFLDKLNIKYLDYGYSIIIPPILYNNSTPKLVLMCHTDHPGIVLKNNEEGVLMGLIGNAPFKELLGKRQVGLKIYNPEGILAGKGLITDIYGGPKQKVHIKTNLQVPLNSYGQFDIDYYSESESFFEVYNADDGISVATMLKLLVDKVKSKFNVYYVFNLYEEVHQLSSWYLAKNNVLKLSEQDLIINLECLKTESISESDFGKIDYEGGIVLQLSNNGCLFGYKNKGANLSENFIKKIASDNGIRIQLGVIKDSCDSRPFTQFSLTSNICTLTIPNKYKHNGSDDGLLRTEHILKRHIIDFYTVLTKILSEDPTTLSKIADVESLSQKLKQHDHITNYKLMKEKAILNERLEIAYKDIVYRKHFFPVNIKELLIDLTFKYVSYLIYIYLKFLSLYERHLNK